MNRKSALLLAAALLAGAASGCTPKAKPDEPVAPAASAPTPTPRPEAPEPVSAAKTEEPGVAPADPQVAAPVVAVGPAASLARAQEGISRGPDGYASAESHLRDALRQDPQLYQAWFNLGVIQQRQGKKDDARASYQKAIEIAPTFMPPYVNQASMLREEKDYDRALDLLSTALKQAPKNPYVRNERVAVLRAMGRTSDAIDEAHRLIKDNSNDVSAFVNLALAYHDQGNLEMSRLVFEKAFATFPEVSNDARVRHAYGKLLLAAGERDLALATGFDKALELDPGYVECLVNRAQLYLQDSEPKKAEELLRRAVDLDPMNAPARMSLGVALRRLGELDGAKAQYEIILSERPNEVDALYNLGVLYGNYLNDPTKAKEYFERARKVAQDDELVASLDAYIAEAQRNIDTRERTEKLRQLREQAERDKAAREAQQGTSGGSDAGQAPAAPEGGSPAGEEAATPAPPPPQDNEGE